MTSPTASPRATRSILPPSARRFAPFSDEVLVKAERQTITLPEVTLLFDARGARPENAVGIGEFWYEPEVWTLPLSPTSKVLYAGLCSFLGHGQINRKDLRAALRSCTDEEIGGALEDLFHHGLLTTADRITRSSLVPGYEVRSTKDFKG